MTLQAQQLTERREAILRALMDVILREGIASFSVQRVADEAGVSHRTVYRHFPNREALLEGLADWVSGSFADAVGLDSGDFTKVTSDDLSHIAETGFRVFEKNRDLITTYVMLIVGARIRLASRVERTKWFVRVLRDHTRHLSKADAKAAAAVVRCIASTVSWLDMRELSDADPGALARAVRWAMDTLLADLAAGGGPQRGASS